MSGFPLFVSPLHTVVASPRRFLALGLILLSACAAPSGGEYTDPYEPANRAVHGFNKGVDRAVLRPAAQVYGNVVPGPVRQGVDNVASNLGLPSDVVNSLLQGRLEPATRNTLRFVFNTVVGIGGIFDPADAIGLTQDKTDFGETLHVWGVREGAYLEVPLMGPSTERDLAGKIVDAITDPVGAAINSPESDYATGFRAASRFGDRYRYFDFLDTVLYESEDSYAQARLLYLQNRRFELGGQSDAEMYDPYEDPYGN